MTTSPSSHHGHLNLCCPFHSPPPPPPPPPPPQQHPTSTPTSNDQNPQTLNQENPLEIQQQPQLSIHYQHQLSERSSTAAPSFPAPASVTTHDAPPSTDSNTSPTLYTLYENIRCNLDVEKRQAIEKKCQILMEKLNPLPFVPSRNLDFSEHEKVLKRLGLWDFVRTEFDRSVRVDLIAEIVASYDPKSGCSYVNGTRYGVSKADLARAMKLPVKNRGMMDLNLELLEDSTTYFMDFLSDWVLLHGGTWTSIPTEVLIWVSVIMDGHPEKVDWAGLLWFMVEKELTQGEHLVDCYYASHLQCLIKSQCEEIFLKGDTVKMELNGEVREDGEGNREKSVALNRTDFELNLEDNVDESTMEVLASNNVNSAGPSHYENGGKRVIRDEDHITNQSLNASNKKSKIDEKCDDKASDIQTFMDKIYEEFEETIKKRDEEIEKREKEIVSLKCEIYRKEKVAEAYREALVESEKLKCECKNKFERNSMETETVAEDDSNESLELPGEALEETETVAVAEEEGSNKSLEIVEKALEETETLGEDGINKSYEIPEKDLNETETLAVAEEEGSNKSTEIPEEAIICNKRLRIKSKLECKNKFLGVHKVSPSSWKSVISSDKLKLKNIHLGCYPSAEAAARAFDAAKLYLKGSKAKLNFPNSSSSIASFLPPSNTNMSIETIKRVAAEAAKNTCFMENEVNNNGEGESSKTGQKEMKRKGYEVTEDGSKKRFMGVYKNSCGSTWHTVIYLSNLRERIYLGCYPNAEVAARAYDAANLYINGSKANLNFPKEYSIPYLPPDGTLMSPETIKKVAAAAAKNGQEELN